MLGAEALEAEGVAGEEEDGGHGARPPPEEAGRVSVVGVQIKVDLQGPNSIDEWG